MKRPVAIMPYLTSRCCDLRIVSKAQWDKEGLEGFDKRPAGTGSYRYVDRKLGLSISYERVDKHWAGEKPDFKELEIRLAPEATTRLAMLLGGEAHIVDLPRELQKEATGRGMKLLSSSYPVDWISIYFGGQYYLPGDPKFKADVPWTNKKVRQAMNMAVNRKELLETIFAGKATPVYVSGWLPISEGWNPEWATRFDQLYGYNPAKAKELLKEAGYPDGTVKVKSWRSPTRASRRARWWPRPWGCISKTWASTPRSRPSTRRRYETWAEARTRTAASAPNIVGWRPSEERIRTALQSRCGQYLSGRVHRKALSGPDAERRPWRRQRIAQEIGDHLFEEFAAIPLFWLYNEVAVNPKVVAEWTYPGLGGGRSTHYHLLKAAK